jgi:hypothetical protein
MGDFFIRAKAVEAGEVCYSDYTQVHIISEISEILIMGDQRLHVTHKIDMIMGKYQEFQLTIMDRLGKYYRNKEVAINLGFLQRPPYLIKKVSPEEVSEYLEFVNNL